MPLLQVYFCCVLLNLKAPEFRPGAFCLLKKGIICVYLRSSADAFFTARGPHLYRRWE